MSVETDILAQAGLPAGGVQVQMMSAWTACEDGAGHNNPLNVTGRFWTGYVGDWNSIPVAIFDTLANGVSACAQNLKNGSQYAGIRAAFQAGDPAAFANDPGIGIWGTNPDCLRGRLAGIAATSTAPTVVGGVQTSVSATLGGLVPAIAPLLPIALTLVGAVFAADVLEDVFEAI